MPYVFRERGRPKIPDSDRKACRIYARVPKITYDEIMQVCRAEGISASDYFRVAVEEALDRDLDRLGYSDEDDYED